MSDSDLQVLERRLRSLPPLLSVPPVLVERSLTTGAGARPSRRSAAQPRRRRTVGWVITAGAILAVLAVASLAMRGQTRYHRIANLTGAGSAAGYVAVGPPDGSLEPVVVSVTHLRPAPPGSYYQISFRARGTPVPGAVFGVGANGATVVHLHAPAHTRWVRCWITLHSRGEAAAGHVVMSGTRTPST